MKKRWLRFLSTVLAVAMLLTVLPFAISAESGNKDYTITSAYENVNWETWNAYKTQLHVHTIASDGAVQLDETVEIHYALDYDILAITDHAIPHKGWTVEPQTIPLFRLVKYERTKMSKVIPLTEERATEIANGVGRNGKGMLDVKTGVELNGAVPSNSHVNGYFADYGQGLFGVCGDYETPVRENGEAGGITFLDHICTYLEYVEKLEPEMEDSEANINKFAKIFLKYPSCAGMDVGSGTYKNDFSDVKLYDNVLQKTIPNGVTPWCFTFSDAHSKGPSNLNHDRAFTVHMMTELTETDLRRSMEEGTFFSITRDLGNKIVGDGPYPIVTSIAVNDSENSITLTSENADNIVWVADGVEIAQGATIDLNDYEDKITCYVRAYLVGPGGRCYVQPFTVIETGTEYTPVRVPETFDYSNVLRMLTTVLDALVFKNSVTVSLFKRFVLGL